MDAGVRAPRGTDTRTRVIEAAAQLLREEGTSAVTTRGVAAAAGVQPPVIYRLFGDKDGLLEAVAEHVVDRFVAAKAAGVKAAAEAGVDALEDLRAGWGMQIEFALANPTIFRLLSEPGRAHSAGARSGREVLESRVHRVALAGRLRVSESRCVELIRAAGTGVVQMLLSTPPEARDPGLADAMYRAVLREVVTGPGEDRVADARAAAVALRAHVSSLGVLSSAERQLMSEWLERLIERP